MSTGSSDSGTGSTSDQDQPGPRAGEANTTMTSNSGLYVKMQHPS